VRTESNHVALYKHSDSIKDDDTVFFQEEVHNEFALFIVIFISLIFE